VFPSNVAEINGQAFAATLLNIFILFSMLMNALNSIGYDPFSLIGVVFVEQKHGGLCVSFLL
jgi:hypothetical protein